VVGVPTGGLAVRTCGLPTLASTLELAKHAIDDDFEMQLSHAGDDSSARCLGRCGHETSDLPRRVWQARCRACPARPLVLGSMAMSMTGSGKTIDSSSTGLPSAHSVSPVVVFFKPTAATISPAEATSISSRWLACICKRRPMRSLWPFVEFKTYEPESKEPE